MSAWRRKALELFPEEKTLLNSPLIFSVYQWFFDLLPMAENAYSTKNFELLAKIFAYAEWCFRNGDIEDPLHSAAVAAFYEHLVDTPTLSDAALHWIPPDLFAELQVIFEMRINAMEYQQLLLNYDARNGTNFVQNLRSHQ